MISCKVMISLQFYKSIAVPLIYAAYIFVDVDRDRVDGTGGLRHIRTDQICASFYSQ